MRPFFRGYFRSATFTNVLHYLSENVEQGNGTVDAGTAVGLTFANRQHDIGYLPLIGKVLASDAEPVKLCARNCHGVGCLG